MNFLNFFLRIQWLKKRYILKTQDQRHLLYKTWGLKMYVLKTQKLKKVNFSLLAICRVEESNL